MKPAMSLGSIWGVPITIHWSLSAVFALLTWSLATGYFPDAYPDLSTGVTWAIAVLTAGLFFASILLHELGHVRVAQRNGLHVAGVRLWIFGGIATIEGQPKSAGAEFRIAIAGPVVSAVIAAIAFVAFRLDHEIDVLAAPSQWLFRVNLALLLFNMLPGFPLDGGRVLRAVIWRVTDSLPRATRIAGSVGQVVALALMGVGLFIAVQGNLVNGIWLGVIGWFLQNAATGEAQAVTIEQRFDGVRAEHVLTREFVTIPGRLTAQMVIDQHVLTTGRRVFVVADESGPRGIVSLSDLVRTPADKREWVRVEETMTPWRSVLTVAPTAPMMEILTLLASRDLHQVPVVDADGAIAGMVGREDIVRYLETMRELGR
jgi:Zn-dependent protease/CBS domain-containing protein